MARDVFAEIEQEIRENKVIIYMKGNPTFPMCGFSAAAVECLKQYGYPFAHVDVLEDPEKREAIKQYSDWPTIPQIYIGGQFIGGCDIIRELHASGELRALLEQAFADLPVASEKA
ncbi:MAG: Grx4 family monothiol glutaredoxin [Candidatus Binatia bacterium]|nr:Grx4 family monothiol glutaredoxin [Candidatus Binatia bacterium]